MLCLTVPTDPAWASNALRDEAALLIDHAHCEIKAASNALSLAGRHSNDLALTQALADIAREEIAHFKRVVSLLATRGLALGPATVDAYAAELRRAASQLASNANSSALVDRLLVGALIEARSCERFKLLAEATAGNTANADLHDFWNELFATEARHYRTFVDLAARVASEVSAGEASMHLRTDGHVAARLAQLAAVEGAIVVALGLSRGGAGASRATIHG